jgi:hypothetical protein
MVMQKRILVVCLGALALLWVFSAQVVADDKSGDTHEGKLVSITAEKLVMTDKSGKEHSHNLTQDTKLLIDGKPAKPRDFKEGMRIKVTTLRDDKTQATRVEAKTSRSE